MPTWHPEEVREKRARGRPKGSKAVRKLMDESLNTEPTVREIRQPVIRKEGETPGETKERQKNQIMDVLYTKAVADANVSAIKMWLVVNGYLKEGAGNEVEEGKKGDKKALIRNMNSVMKDLKKQGMITVGEKE
jgi:hypothetical protein